VHKPQLLVAAEEESRRFHYIDVSNSKQTPCLLAHGCSGLATDAALPLDLQY
jgi:hypothetical protein